MKYSNLPNEIIIEISRNLHNEQDIAFLARVNWRFYHLFDEYLNSYNIRYRKSGALSWAARNCRESTARKLLHLGANVNAKTRSTRFSGGRHVSSLTPLHWAALKGHLPMVKLLLEVRADVTNYFDDRRVTDDRHSMQMTDGDVGQPEKINIGSFPALNNASGLPDFGSELNIPEGLWSPSNTKDLVAGFCGPGRAQTLPIAEIEIHVDPFPYLSNHIPKNLVETDAGKLWAGLEKPKSHRIAGCEIHDPIEIQKDSIPGIKGKKMGGKKQWQPLNL